MQAEHCGLAAGVLHWENPLIYCERSGSSRKEGNRALNRVSKKRPLPKSFPQEIFCVMGQRGCGDTWRRSLGATLLPVLQPEWGSSTPWWVSLGKSQLQKQTSHLWWGVSEVGRWDSSHAAPRLAGAVAASAP